MVQPTLVTYTLLVYSTFLKMCLAQGGGNQFGSGATFGRPLLPEGRILSNVNRSKSLTS